jgi:hypothetical protein
MLSYTNDVRRILNESFIRPIVFTTFLLISGLIQAQTTFLNRPSKTESAIVLEKGVFQLESAYETELVGEPGEREKAVLFPEIMLRYGLGWGVELRFANQYKSYKDQFVSIKGYTDIDIGAKMQLIKRSDRKNEVALISHFFFPTGSKGISNERLGNESSVIIWHELNEKVGIEYSIGYSNYEMDSEKGNFIYSFVTDYEINDKSGFFIETYGELIEFSEFESSIDLGIAYQLTDNLEFELAAGTGINHRLFFTLIGLSWRIGEQEY